MPTSYYIKSSSEFDQYLFEHREEDMFNKRMSDRAKLAHGASILEEKGRVPKCPTCGSTSVQKNINHKKISNDRSIWIGK